MSTLSITVHINARAAIMAGKVIVGRQSFVVSPEGLAVLPEAWRFELALAYESGEDLGSIPSEPDVIEASLDAIKPVLAFRASKRQAADAAKKIKDAADAERAAVSARESAATENKRARALRAWVDEHEDEDHKARMAEGFLPEREILDAVTDELLDIQEFPMYEALMKGEACDCHCAPAVRFTTVTPPPYLDAKAHGNLRAIRNLVPAGATVVPVEHKAHCPDCTCAPIARISALVSLPWNGFALEREFLIG